VTVFDREPARLAALSDVATTSLQLDELRKFEWLVECTGDPGVLTQVLRESATGATVLLLGLPYGEQHFNFESLVGFDKAVVGSVGSAAVDVDAALALLPALDTSRLTAVRFPLQQFDRAWAAARSKAPLKVMIGIDEHAC
jgi:threonine dehydrogenase-like Zn-dependent dehydrogenase